MRLVCVGLSHRTAPLEVRERVAFDRDRAARFLGRADPILVERAILSTCNRTELYAVGAESEPLAEIAAGALAAETGSDSFRPGGVAYRHEGRDAALHLMRVACGLDARILGESQILTQVRGCLSDSVRAGAAGPMLRRLMEMAQRLSGKVRAETSIGHGAVSYGSAAIDRASAVLGGLAGRRALVVGAGKMGSLAARHLADVGVGELVVVNRTHDAARRLAAEISARPAPMASLEDEIVAADLVVSTTDGGVTTFRRDRIAGLLPRRRSPVLLLMDVAVPRSVDPSLREVDGVVVEDIETLDSAIRGHLDARRGAVPQVERACRAATERYFQWASRREADETIRALQMQFDTVARAELERTLRRVPENHHAAVESYTRSLVRKLLHGPTKRLRENGGRPANGHTIELIRELFGIEGGDAPADRDAI